MEVTYLLFTRHLENLKFSVRKRRTKKEAYNHLFLNMLMNSLWASISACLYSAVKLKIKLGRSLIFLEPSKLLIKFLSVCELRSSVKLCKRSYFFPENSYTATF